ncbi:MAG: SMC-Scp complex subunit ScpB [Candidatus Kapabacteria bacterium]|nr:SMC-Scp complex subunit ScpB [Candidatus Kapabacteria bacterium]
MEFPTPKYFNLSDEDKLATIEALVFSSEETISSKQLFEILIEKEFLAHSDWYEEYKSIDSIENYIENILLFTQDKIKDLIEQININLIQTNRPFQIVNFAGGFQYAIRAEYGSHVAELVKSKTKKRLSQATLETLAIIAYKQPVTKPVIEQIRGVNSKEIISSLLEKNFIKIVGRSESIGKPLLYGTTDDFLKTFGLNTLVDLPKLREIDEIANIDIIPSDDNQLVIRIFDEEVDKIRALAQDIDLIDFDINNILETNSN